MLTRLRPFYFNHHRGFTSSILQSWERTYQEMSDSYVVSQTSSLIGDFHDVTGLPWWAVIAATGFTLRFITMFPAHLTAQKTAAKRALIMQEMEETIVPELTHSYAYRARKNNIHPELMRRELNRHSKLIQGIGNREKLFSSKNIHPLFSTNPYLDDYDNGSTESNDDNLLHKGISAPFCGI
ncbi:uncharacterized protein [Lepeophtheirus salmonis]|uniref:uncharacterized protein isoform X2 n=1 Tax=Lepeophtheirus salmonis TaxID=72036 RepID=UPI003AF38046